MGLVWVSLSWRARVNVEALNMAEAVGNYVKHRRAPIAYYDEFRGEYVVRYVPVVSGESLGHAYQVWLAREAEKLGLSVCELCRKGEMVKHGARVVLKDEGLPTDAGSVEEAAKLEREIIRRCVVEDVGGFLVPTRVPVKRTSRFYVGYMVPAADAIKAAALEPQFHVRHAPSLVGREAEFRETGQAIYYVEVGSAVYTASFAVDLTGIGVTSMLKIEPAVDRSERLKRAEAAVRAAYYLLAGMFGAKRTRFLPDYELLSAVAAVSTEVPFNVSPGHGPNFIAETAERAKRFAEFAGGEVKVLAYVAEPAVEKKGVPETVERLGSPEELVSRLCEEARQSLEKALR